MSSKDDGIRPWGIRPATRPDAGGGHVARCAALGAALAAYGPVAAIVEKGGDAWARRFRDAGFDVVPEAEFRIRRWAGVVLDDYGFQGHDIASWRQTVAGPIVQVVDDNVPLPGIDLAVNATPGLSGSRLGEVPALLGATFAMLASPYAGRPEPKIGAVVERVVVGIGWIDAAAATDRVLAALARAAQPDTQVDVVLGSASPNISQVAAMTEARINWRLHRDAQEPWRLLEGAGLAISGAGQSLLERLAFGIPTLAVAVAANQKPALAGVVEAGAAASLGDLDELSEDRIASAFTALAGDTAARMRMSAAAQRLIDGQGAARVASYLVELSRRVAA
jgi:UDP-2,4-diacetamido-2,4,6-trideoxy-beta-L-altropyranose hydrolase